MNKKIIVPVLIGILVCIYCFFVGVGIVSTENSTGKLIFNILTLSGIVYVVLKLVNERIAEIKSGEEDDLHKY